MTDPIHVFVYDQATLSGIESEAVRDDAVKGTLFDVDDVGPALMLAGQARIAGQVRRVPSAALLSIDRNARVEEGLFRRIGVSVGDTPCWAWVAGPRLAPRLGRTHSREG